MKSQGWLQLWPEARDITSSRMCIFKARFPAVHKCNPHNNNNNNNVQLWCTPWCPERIKKKNVIAFIYSGTQQRSPQIKCFPPLFSRQDIAPALSKKSCHCMKMLSALHEDALQMQKDVVLFYFSFLKIALHIGIAGSGPYFLLAGLLLLLLMACFCVCVDCSKQGFTFQSLR